MINYLTDILPRLQKFSKKLDELTILSNQHWVLIDSINDVKYVYIFRSNNELLISKDGKVEKAKWEYLGNNSLLIDRQNESFIFKHGFIDDNILALKIDGKEEYSVFINESKYSKEFNSINQVNEFLYSKYLRSKIDNNLKINKNEVLSDTMTYEIVKKNWDWDLFLGKITIFYLNFNNGEVKGNILYVYRKKKFGFFVGCKFKLKLKYFDNKEDCISEFYETKKKNR